MALLRSVPRRARCFPMSSISVSKQLHTWSAPTADLISPDLKYISQSKSLGTFEITCNKSVEINFKRGSDVALKEAYVSVRTEDIRNISKCQQLFLHKRVTRRHYGLQTNTRFQRKSGYLEGVCQYLIPKCMSGPAHCSSFQAFPALFPASITAITKDELSDLRKCVFSQTRHADCVRTFTFSNKVLCQHKFYAFFNVHIILLQSRSDFQRQSSTQASCALREDKEPVPHPWMSEALSLKMLKLSSKVTQ